MSLHQIIYTSCRCGIKGAGDGLQVFSHDRQFPQQALPDVQNMFSYSHPRLPAGQAMTDEMVPQMPSSFFYRFLRDGSCALAQNTYLGHDYMGKTGRFGNYMSHVILFQQPSAVHYPCEYWRSSMLKSAMDAEEVNSPDVPAYLPEPDGEAGNVISVATVSAFLRENNRLEIYRHMLAALLDFRREKKRLIILDDAEYIIFWIAALEYALPLHFAQRLNFNTYEYSPDTSLARICGVVEEGTKFSLDHAAQHYVFDIRKGNYPEFPAQELLTLAAEAFQSEAGYQELTRFHEFLRDNYDFHLTNDRLYDACHLFSLLEKRKSLPLPQLEGALAFAAEYGRHDCLTKIIPQMAQGLATVQELSLFVCLLSFLGQAAAKTGINAGEQSKSSFVHMLTDLFATAHDREEFQAKAARLSVVGRELGLDAEHCLQEKTVMFSLAQLTSEHQQEWQLQYCLEQLQMLADHDKQELAELAAEDEETIFALLRQGMLQAERIEGCQKLMVLISKLLQGRADYIDRYYLSLSEIYYERLCEFDGQKAFRYKVQLLKQLQYFSGNIRYAETLICDLLGDIPFQSLNEEQQAVVDLIAAYQHRQQMNPAGKISLLGLGNYLQRVQPGRLDWDELEKYLPIAVDVTEEELNQYWEWIMPDIIRLFANEKDLNHFVAQLGLTPFQKQFFALQLEAAYESRKKANPVKQAVQTVAKVFASFRRR